MHPTDSSVSTALHGSVVAHLSIDLLHMQTQLTWAQVFYDIKLQMTTSIYGQFASMCKKKPKKTWSQIFSANKKNGHFFVSTPSAFFVWKRHLQAQSIQDLHQKPAEVTWESRLNCCQPFLQLRTWKKLFKGLKNLMVVRSWPSQWSMMYLAESFREKHEISMIFFLHLSLLKRNVDNRW